MVFKAQMQGAGRPLRPLREMAISREVKVGGTGPPRKKGSPSAMRLRLGGHLPPDPLPYAREPARS